MNNSKFLTTSITITKTPELITNVRFIENTFQQLLGQFITVSRLNISLSEFGHSKAKVLQKTNGINQIDWKRIAKNKGVGIRIDMISKEWFEEHLDPRLGQLSLGITQSDDSYTTIGVGIQLTTPIAIPIQKIYATWAKSTFTEFNGVTGYITYERLDGNYFSASAFEHVMGYSYPRIINQLHQHSRGYFWGNLLSMSHVELLGGEHKLLEFPAYSIEQLGSIGYYIQLTEDINSLQLSNLAQLKTHFRPLLPKPLRPASRDQYSLYMLVPDDDPPIPEPPKPVEITPKVKLEMPKVEFQEVHQWLQNDDPLSALAINRFKTPEAGREFIHQLLQLGALVYVKVTTYADSPAPHSDALLVKLPTEPAQRQQLLKIFTQELIHEGFIEEDEVDETVEDNGEEQLYFWWD